MRVGVGLVVDQTDLVHLLVERVATRSEIHLRAQPATDRVQPVACTIASSTSALVGLPLIVVSTAMAGTAAVVVTVTTTTSFGL